MKIFTRVFAALILLFYVIMGAAGTLCISHVNNLQTIDESVSSNSVEEVICESEVGSPVCEDTSEISLTSESVSVDTTSTEQIEEKKRPSIEDAVASVINGKYGNGEKRVIALKNEGYSDTEISEIQKSVDSLCVKESKSQTVSATKSSTIYNNQSPITSVDGRVGEVATAIWNILTCKYGMSQVTAAGILGNVMQECGGRTLTGIKPWCDGCGYGLFQWTSGRRNLLLQTYNYHPSVEDQLEFMYNELTGKVQVSEKHCQEILNASTPEEAARLFAIYFERCGSGSYGLRQTNARNAYNLLTQIN